MLLVVISPPTVLSVMKRSCGVVPRLAYARVSVIDNEDANTSRKNPEVSIRLAFDVN